MRIALIRKNVWRILAASVAILAVLGTCRGAAIAPHDDLGLNQGLGIVMLSSALAATLKRHNIHYGWAIWIKPR